MAAASSDKFISRAADKLIAAHDGDVALLCIYLERRGCVDLEAAARDLCRTMQEIEAAYEKLRRMGLSEPADSAQESRPVQTHLPAPEELPQYQAAEIKRRSMQDNGFAAVLQEAEQVMGHTLSGSDMQKLFGIYDYLALPAEVIMVLLHHCAEENRRRNGEGRRLSMRMVEKQAYIWANNEILSLEQAEEYIENSKSRRDRLSRAKEALEIRGRELTGTELKYVSSWLDMGFDAELLAIAYDRTVTHAGSLKWPYMNKILLSWKEKKLFTPADIAEKDAPRGRGNAKPAGSKQPVVDAEELRKMLEKI